MSDSVQDDLPPVQPPSAGFILQLFVVPGLIVLAVVAVWALFGRIAAGEQDWKTLVEEVQSPNHHIRTRAMYGLAQVLEQDQRRGESGLRLNVNTEIASALSSQLSRELKSNSTSKESLAIQEYLTRALGYLDTPELVMPALRLSLEPQYDIEVRKSGATSIAMVAGRAFEKGDILEDPETVESLVKSSGDSQPIMRQASVFALGLFKSEIADQQVHVLLGNDDWNTCVNAAIALARQGNTDGLSVFKQALITKPPEKPEDLAMQFVIMTNTMKALTMLAPKMSEADKSEFRDILKNLSSNHAEIRIRVDAQNALQSLK